MIESCHQKPTELLLPFSHQPFHVIFQQEERKKAARQVSSQN
jgi:hypothetical protein